MRVSKNDQNTDLQRKSLICTNCDQIFEDKMNEERTISLRSKQDLKSLKLADSLEARYTVTCINIVNKCIQINTYFEIQIDMRIPAQSERIFWGVNKSNLTEDIPILRQGCSVLAPLQPCKRNVAIKNGSQT